MLLPLYEQLGYIHTIKTLAKVYANFASMQKCNLIAFDENSIVKGICAFVILPHSYKEFNQCFLDVLVVHQDFREQGIGSKLLEAMENIAKDNNCSSIALTSNINRSQNVKNYYINRGYNNSGLQAQVYLRKAIKTL